MSNSTHKYLYYLATDTLAEKANKKKLNYLNLWTGNQSNSSYNEVFGYYDPYAASGKESDFTPGMYSILPKSNLSSLVASMYNDNVDPKIIGFLEIASQDPNLAGKFTVTSLYREGAKTAQGRDSFHGKGLAADIVATNGDFDELESLIMGNKQLVAYCKSNGLGIIDEYSKEGRKRALGSTGPCMHIGPDQLALSDFKKLELKHGHIG